MIRALHGTLQPKDRARVVGPASLRTGAALVSVGSCFPETTVATTEIAGPMGVEPEWLVRRTGVEARRRLQPGECLNDLAATAARAALAEADVDPATVDLLLMATMTPDALTPHSAAIVASDIGATRAGTMDLNSACTGFLAALAMAVGQVESGRARTVVVIGADAMSRVLDYEDRVTGGIFGDGAGAVVVRAVDGDSRVGPFILESDGSAGDAIVTAWPAGPVRMEGQRTFRRAVDSLVDVAERATALVGASVDDLDLAVLHQANARITAAVGERLELPPERVVDCIAQIGNTTSASLPTALAVADADGRLQPGSLVLLGAFGAGLAWGGTVLTWGLPD
ncbi:MAG TPA: beta-ketoacyl-ACP synthase 3 [Baekduia sp.]|uniref:3-oxoacyl-ACP synthase III family protein n=1 Tax=Baekduia sp. TaxID=2600305 RepID=UPI002BDF0F58|nr:beta-ketoacyl-ACP synthase 3 [Baekduia sp.]HMJ32522.1 beta-ketoacyl-ACP synthase 3 [Baekduia sp.]